MRVVRRSGRSKGNAWRQAAAIAVLVAGAACPSASAQTSLVDAPTVKGPIAADAIGSGSRDYPFGSSVQDLASRGYVEEEFFYSGSTPAGEYTTRMLVRRPADPAKFSGTVIAEWQNVTNLYDLDALWIRSAEHVMREGDAYVAIDAQAAGVVSPTTGLKAWSPKRYGALQFPSALAPLGGVPADAGMFDIFGQGLRAIREPAGIDPLGPLKPKRVLATGTSQSALYLWMYAQLYDPPQRLVDGFLITAAATSTLGQNGATAVALPMVTTVPVLWLNTETDYAYVRQPDTDTFRLWEVAGTTHLDRDARDIQEVIIRRDLHTEPKPLVGCEHRPFSRIPFRYAQNAAVEALETWTRTGTPPRSRPGFDYDDDGLIERDAFENALGGVRLPQMDVPISNESRENTGSCRALYGRSVPFTPERLHALYPTHEDYVRKVQEVAAAALKNGVLLEPDLKATVAAARAAPVPEASPPARATCRSRRVVKLTFPGRVGRRVVTSVSVAVPGRRAVRVRSRTLRLSLVGLTRRTVRVRIILRLRGGGSRTVVRTLTTCARR